jgi:hypothetical protein
VVIAPLAIAVVFPVLVTGPVKLAFVVTVSALPVTLPVILPVKTPAIAPAPVIVGAVNVLLASVAAAARSVALEVLSTFPKPTSPLTNPVGELITGDVKVLPASVSSPPTVANVPVSAGKVNVVVPATAVATSLVPPEVDPANVAPPPPMIGNVKVLPDSV